MLTDKNNPKKVLLTLLKDFNSIHTITSLAEQIKLSRVGIWLISNRLEEEHYCTLTAIGKGKTSTSFLKLNLDNILLEKTLILYLTEEALEQKRWYLHFASLEKEVDFLILYGSILHAPQLAHDIDILCIANKKNFVKIQHNLDIIQKTTHKKIHTILFTEQEFLKELEKSNEAFVDAVKNGIVLYGQEKFITCMKKVYLK